MCREACCAVVNGEREELIAVLNCCFIGQSTMSAGLPVGAGSNGQAPRIREVAAARVGCRDARRAFGIKPR